MDWYSSTMASTHSFCYVSASKHVGSLSTRLHIKATQLGYGFGFVLSMRVTSKTRYLSASTIISCTQSCIYPVLLFGFFFKACRFFVNDIAHQSHITWVWLWLLTFSDGSFWDTISFRFFNYFSFPSMPSFA